MILVRIVLQAKWGAADAVAKAASELAVEAVKLSGVGRVRVLTDLSGPFHTVVQEIEVDSLAGWETNRAKAFAQPEILKIQERLAGLVESGYQEFYTIEHSS